MKPYTLSNKGEWGMSKSLDEIKEKITKYGFVLGEKMHQEDF